MKTPYILLTLVLLLGSTLLVQAYSQAGTLTVKVDKTNYGVGEIVKVSGTVPAVLEGVPVAVQVFNSRNTMYTILQTTTNADGTYSTSFDITGKFGISGVYTVRATYSGQSVQTTFQFTGGISPTFQIIIPAGTATPGCEAANKCWDPSTITVPAGTTVVWTNKDTAGHTVTSGNPGDAYSGSLFDSTKDPSGFLIKPGTTWKHIFDKAGEFPYFCAVHPWMLGKVIVGSASTQITIGASTQASSFTIGDTVRISGSVKPVTIGQPLVIQVFNPNGSSFRFDQIKVDSSGSFAYSFKIEGTLATIGNYRIDIGYFDSKKSLIINVEKGVSITTGKISISDTGLVDASGSSISHMSVGQQVLVQSKVMNNQDVTQDYAYILQIKNSDDIVVSLSWVQGSINPKQSLNVAQSWLPDSSGIYTAQIFVWRSITNPLPLASSIVELKIDVSA